MSRVFAATDTTLDRSVVVKVLEPDLAATVNVERFRREIQVAAKLQHAYIVPLLAAGATGELPFYTMPFVEGESLRAMLQSSGALPIPDAVRILRDVAEALVYAHEHGVIHRDIKPDNILVTRYHALVTDFGVAKALSAAADAPGSLTSVGVALGTPAYMAPEQAVGDKSIDHRADIYSLGAVGYEMLTGQRVFSERPAQAMLAAHAIEKPEALERRRASTPASLASLVMQCLEKHPADRPQTAREVLTQLESIAVSGGSSASSAIAERGSIRPSNTRRRLMTAGMAVLVVTAAAAWWLGRPGDAAAGSTSLVVLPFENLGEASDQYFADGVSEEVTNRLVKLSGLSVIARSGAAQYRKSGKTAQQIGKELDVEYVLDGTVRWARSAAGGNLVRVTPQLMKVSSGRQVWGEPYEAVLSEVFAVQTQIAENVAQAIGGKLAAAERQSLARASTRNVQANDAYMLGRFHWKQRSPQSLERAAQFFQQAIAHDPGFARAHAGLADSYGLFPFYDVTSLSSAESYRRAKASALRAIELDSTLAEAYASLGEVVFNSEWDFARAHRLLQRATLLDPGYATGHQWLGEVLFAIGHVEQSVAALRKAKELEPLSAVIATSLGFALWSHGDNVAANREFENAVAIDPTLALSRFMSAMFYMEQRQFDRAQETLLAAGAPPPFVGQLLDGMRREQARPAAVKALHGSRGKSPELYTLLGERDSAFAMMEREVRRKEGFIVVGLKTNPIFAKLRSDPRYERILRLAGLTDSQLTQAGIPPPSR